VWTIMAENLSRRENCGLGVISLAPATEALLGSRRYLL
jgi:hypothetical protein